MNTPPPESEFPKPELQPSLSMPVPQLPLANTSPPANPRRRRHTLATRTDASVEMVSDGDDNDDQTLDRISGILSTLLQEANDAVQNNNGAKSVSSRQPRPRPHSALLRPSTSTYCTTSSRPKSIQSISRLPRPTRSTQPRRTHDRHSSISSSASSASLFSPAPTTAESPITASSVEPSSSCFLDQQQKDNDGDIADLLQRSSSPCSFDYYSGTDVNSETRQPHDDDHDNYEMELPSATTRYTLPRFDEPLMESFRRLDTSMAMVESLSRDLAQQQEDGDLSFTAPQGPRSFISSTSTSKLALLFLPLLHIPHALITTVFDTLISSPGNTQTTTWKWSSSTSSFVNASSSFSGIVAWTLCFALANIVVTWSGAPSPFLTRSSADIVRPRRLSLPGSYNGEKESHRMERSKRPTPINTTLCTKKSATPIRRTPIKRSTPFTSATSRKRTSSRHPPSSTSMAITQSNDRSYALAIQQSRAWKKQQQQQQQQQIPDGWDAMDGEQPLIITRRRHSF